MWINVRTPKARSWGCGCPENPLAGMKIHPCIRMRNTTTRGYDSTETISVVCSASFGEHEGAWDTFISIRHVCRRNDSQSPRPQMVISVPEKWIRGSAIQ
jgi:hypothetical protein